MAKIVNNLAAKVEAAIISHEKFKVSWKIDVLENGGIITLRGAVPTKEHLQLAESIASEQEGVISVNNELDIDITLDENPEELNPEEDIKLPPRRQRPYGKH